MVYYVNGFCDIVMFIMQVLVAGLFVRFPSNLTATGLVFVTFSSFVYAINTEQKVNRSALTVIKNQSKDKYITKWQSTMAEFGFHIPSNESYSQYSFPTFEKLNHLCKNIKLCEPKWKEIDNCFLKLSYNKTVSITVRSPQYKNECCYSSPSDKSIKPSFANLNLNADLSADQLKQLFLITELLQATSNKINISIQTTNCENTLAETLTIASTLYNASKTLNSQGFNKYKYKADESNVNESNVKKSNVKESKVKENNVKESDVDKTDVDETDVQYDSSKTITVHINLKKILNCTNSASYSDQAKLNHPKSKLMDDVPNDFGSWITIKKVERDPVIELKQVTDNKCKESIVISRHLFTSPVYQPGTLKTGISQPSQIDVTREDIRIEINKPLVSEQELTEAFQNLDN
jgi:hypothetical protein